ncbi:unnamed protein product [Coffea canephora]|uniref:DOG1 domain-containing protein n=1 Tax=Coffea canephora TaxID=49390 RepID=A0A068TKU2_COFCA|nr:unnamed protein product [Coffea canephora]
MASSSPSPSTHRGQQKCCFHEWMILQEADLSEMLQALTVEDNFGDRDVLLRQLVQKNVEHFQAYADERTRLAQDHVSPFFAPSWCSSLENSLLWLAGCRPSLFITLIYALSGIEIESHIPEFLQGTRTSELSELSLAAPQLSMINQLQRRTIKQEEELSQQLACLQEKIADQPFALIAKESSHVASQNVQADEALDEHSTSMVRILEEADKLRIKTLKEMMNILSPVQAVDFLVAGKKLHLCIHDWGQKRDIKHDYFQV